MSFELKWYLSKRIILARLTGELDLDQVEALAKNIYLLIDEGIAPVHILIDDTKGGRPPISLNQLKARLTWAEHPSLGWVVAIGEADPVAKFLVPLLMKIMKIEFVRYPTLLAAVEFLKKRDLTLQE